MGGCIPFEFKISCHNNLLYTHVDNNVCDVSFSLLPLAFLHDSCYSVDYLILPMPFDLSRHLWRQNVKRKGRCTSQWGSMRLRFREDWIRKDILMLHLSNEITIVILILWCRISDFVFLTLNLFAYHGFHSLLCCQVFLHK